MNRLLISGAVPRRCGHPRRVRIERLGRLRRLVPHDRRGADGTVAVKQIDGVGNVLVASNGKALYSPDQEASGMILCTGACASIWTPLAAASGTPTAMPGVTLGVIDRPDGTKQVTADGKPLYTFSEDSAGKVTGNDVSDSFGSQHFTWHALLADGQTAASSGTPGTSSGGASPGYGY